MDRDRIIDVYQLFVDEFETISFLNNLEGENFLKLLLIYKLKLDLNFRFNDTPIKLIDAADYGVADDACNAIVIGGAPIKMDALDELTSAFINNSIGADEDEQMYQIYSIPERAIVQITKMDATASYSSVIGYGTRQMLLSLITKLLPWYFDGLSEEQMQIVRDTAVAIISEDGIQKMNEIFEETIRDSGIIERIEQEKLDKMGERILKNRSQNIRDELDYKQRSYEDYCAAFMKLATEIRELKIQLNAIENSQCEFENPITELRQFIQESPFDYKLDHVSNDKVYLAYRVPLTSYSTEDEYESMIKNASSSSMFLDRFVGGYDIDVVKEAYKRIIEDKDCIVWTCGIINIDMYNYTVDVATNIKREHSMNHPHLNSSISCFGTASTTIIGYLKQARVFEAMNAIAYATQQFTLYDSYAANIFIDGIESKQCIECPDGEYRNFHELIKAIEKGEI